MELKSIHLKEFYPFLDKNGADPILDTYIQLDASERVRPAIIVIPGGGYAVCCYDREGEPVALEYLADGINAFVLKYSVMTHSYPQQILELAAAFDYVRTHAEEFNIDPEKVAVTGFSAGGHLAASYCTLLFDEAVTKYITPKPANAAILGYPVISAKCKTHKGTFDFISGHDPITAEDVEKFSLEGHICDATPPTYIYHTTDDAVVNVENSIRYATALAEKGILFELHIFPHGPHGIANSKSPVYPDGYWKDPEIVYDTESIREARVWLKNLFGY